MKVHFTYEQIYDKSCENSEGCMKEINSLCYSTIL